MKVMKSYPIGVVIALLLVLPTVIWGAGWAGHYEFSEETVGQQRGTARWRDPQHEVSYLSERGVFQQGPVGP